MNNQMCPECVPGGTPHYASAQCVLRLLNSNRVTTAELLNLRKEFQSLEQGSSLREKVLRDQRDRYEKALRQIARRQAADPAEVAHEALGFISFPLI
jgi:hypothetical protein